MSAVVGARVNPETYLFHHSRSFADASCVSGVVSASKKVDDEFIELLITEPVIVVHPVSGVREIKVKLGKV